MYLKVRTCTRFLHLKAEGLTYFFALRSLDPKLIGWLLMVLLIVKVNKLNYNVQKRRKTCLTLLSKKAKQIWSILALKIHVKNS